MDSTVPVETLSHLVLIGDDAFDEIQYFRQYAEGQWGPLKHFQLTVLFKDTPEIEYFWVLRLDRESEIRRRLSTAWSLAHRATWMQLTFFRNAPGWNLDQVPETPLPRYLRSPLPRFDREPLV